jgi:hypothetical protein
MSAFAIFISTTLGKIVLGTTVASASAGIGQLSGVVDIPGLPDRGAQVAPYVDEDDTEDSPGTTDTPATGEVVGPDGPAEVGDQAPGIVDPTGAEGSTDASKDAYGSDFSHDVSTDDRSESTDWSKDAYGSDFSHDVSTDDRSESTDWSKDAYGSDFSHDVSTENCDHSYDASSSNGELDSSMDVSCDEPHSDDEADDDGSGDDDEADEPVTDEEDEADEPVTDEDL